MRPGYIILALLILPVAAGYAEFDHTPIGPFSLVQDEPFSYDFNASFTSNATQVPEDGTIIKYDYSGESVSTWVSSSSFFAFNPNTGVLQYTPSNDDATKNFTIRFLLLEDEDLPSLDEVVVRFQIENVNDPPEITNSTPESPISTAENLTINLTVDALDIDAPYGENLTIFWNIYWPDNGSFENKTLVTSTNESIDPFGDTSVLNYTVGFCDAPQILIEAVARDEGGLEDSVNWTVNVDNVNRNVTFINDTPIQNQTFNESEGLVANFSYWDVFEDPDLVCGDEELTFILNGAIETNITVNLTTGEVIFNATPKWSGNETVSITAIDLAGTNATSNEFIIEVLQVPDPPIGFDPGPQTAYEFAPYELFIRFEDADLPFGDNLTYTINDTSLFTVQWHNQTGNASYARIAFTPSGGSAGTYAFNVTASDEFEETENASVLFTLEIIENAVPIIAEPVILPQGTQDVPYLAMLNATDPDGDLISWFVALNTSIDGNLTTSVLGIGPLNTTIGGYPLASNTTERGELAFTPTNEDVGNHSIILIAVDQYGAQSNITTLLSIENVNDPPFDLEPDGVLLKAKELTNWNYTITVKDPDFLWGDYVNVTSNDSIITLENLTTDGSEWLMSYSPPIESSENRTIELTATDLAGATTTAEFTLEVLPALPPQLILPIPGLVAQATVEYTNTIGAYDPNDDPLIFTFNESVWEDHQTPLGLNRTRINVTYTEDDVGNYSINITVTDIDGMSDSVIVDFIIEPFNLPPELLNPKNMSFVNGTYNNYTFSVEDPEGDPWNVYFEDPFFDWLEITRLDNDTFLVSATPNQSVIGAHAPVIVINQTSFPPRNSTYVLNVTVFSDPQAPEIISRSPTNDVSGIEGGSRIFTVTVDDPNFPGEASNESDRVTLVWDFNGDVVRTNQINETTTDEYLFEYDYCSAPGGTLTLTATDLWNLTASTSWIVDIENVNRPPYFGEHRFTFQNMLNEAEPFIITHGSWTRSNVNATSSLFRQSSIAPGTITSPVLEMGREQSVNKMNLTTVDTTGSGPVFYQVRFSSASPNTNDPSWTAWSNLTAVGDSPGDLFVRRYAQIRFVLNSTDPMELSTIQNSTMFFGFRDQVINSSFTGLDYWFLDDYFTDPDFFECLEDDLNATVADNPPELVILIDDTDRSTDVITGSSFGYTHPTTFTVADNESNATSNVFLIEVVERPDQVNIPQPTTGGSGGGGSSVTIITEPEEVDVPEPEPLEIIAPGTATMVENETITIPISVINRWNETLENIQLTAESENELINLTLGTDFIASLLPDANETFNLTITSFATFGEYAVNVIAVIDDPEFNTTATILINSIELGQRGPEEYNTRLSFARDIVESNQRCIELNEHIERSRNLVAQGETQEAILLLDDIVENCRYLINLDASTLFPADERTWLERTMQDTTSQTQLYVITILIVNALLFGMVGVYLFRNVRARPPASP